MLEGLKEKLAEHKGKAILLGIAGVLGLSIGGPLYSYHGTETVRVTVTDKTEKKIEGTDTEKYLVTGYKNKDRKNLEVFENTDAGLPFHWKYVSGNIQGELQEGGTYDLEVYGWRVPYKSWHRNIVSVEEVSPPPQLGTGLQIQTANVLAGNALEKFVTIDGKKAYLEIDGQPVDTYVKNHK